MMTIETLSPSLWLGLIGWAATAKLIFDYSQFSPLQQRLLIVFTWLLWMVPAFDVTVYQGLMESHVAMSYGTTMSLVPVVLIVLPSVFGKQSRTNKRK
jgi:hypothetical protein